MTPTQVALVTEASRGIGRGIGRGIAVALGAAGRVVAALAADRDLLSHNGRALRVDDLATRYGVDVTT